MDNFIKQLKNASKETRLSSVEKAAIKSQLLHYVEVHPMNVSAFASYSIPSPYSIRNFRSKKTLAGLVIGGLLIGGSVSFAAEGAVPGDLLYPVKININEQVRGVLAITPKAKADWAVQKAERRIQEAEKIFASNSSSSDIKVVAEKNINDATFQVQDSITNFEKAGDTKNATMIAGKFVEVLKKHEHDTMNAESVLPVAVTQNIKSIRDNVEEKYNELNDKSAKDNADREVKTEQSDATSTVSLPQSSSHGNYNQALKIKVGHNEEVGTRANNQEVFVPSQEVMKSFEDNKKDSIRFEDQKTTTSN